jgi:hypothetical protein
MWLLSKRDQQALKDQKIYYINADDDFNGSVSKSELMERYGVHTLIPNERCFDVQKFESMLTNAVETKTAGGIVFILDTLKKFVDMMDKSKARGFNDLLRRFAQAGGTVIALAHTNKHKGANGVWIAEGVGDFTSDFDCAYIADVAAADENQKTVVFKNVKLRGPNIKKVVFTYDNCEGRVWLERFESIEMQDGKQANRMLAAQKEDEAHKKDLETIKYIESRLAGGSKTRVELTQDDLNENNPSRGKRERILEKYNQSNERPEFRHWKAVSGNNGGKKYHTDDL